MMVPDTRPPRPHTDRCRTALALILLLAASIARGSESVRISDPWIRAAPPLAPMAGYLVLENTGPAEAALVGAHSDAFGMVMMHRSYEEGGLAKMAHQDRVEVPAGEQVRFEPGGLHLMLMHPTAVLAAGERVAITLEFADGTRQGIEFEVRDTR